MCCLGEGSSPLVQQSRADGRPANLARHRRMQPFVSAMLRGKRRKWQGSVRSRRAVVLQLAVVVKW